MGVHHFTPSRNTLLLWQKVWGFFHSKNIPSFPQKYLTSDLIKDHDNYIVAEINGEVKQSIKSFQEALSTINQLNSIIKNSTTTSEWNFFGKNDDKEKYSQYIENLFWSNQHHEELSSMPDYSRVLEDKDLLTNYTNYLPFNIKQPLEFFNQPTLKFLQAIETTLKTWSFNPYLSLSSKGTFQWIIKNSQVQISGSVVKVGDDLIHYIQFSTNESLELVD